MGLRVRPRADLVAADYNELPQTQIYIKQTAKCLNVKHTIYVVTHTEQVLYHTQGSINSSHTQGTVLVVVTHRASTVLVVVTHRASTVLVVVTHRVLY